MGGGVSMYLLRAAALWSACGLPPLSVAWHELLRSTLPKAAASRRTPKRCGAENYGTTFARTVNFHTAQTNNENNAGPINFASFG